MCILLKQQKKFKKKKHEIITEIYLKEKEMKQENMEESDAKTCLKKADKYFKNGKKLSTFKRNSISTNLFFVIRRIRDE